MKKYNFMTIDSALRTNVQLAATRLGMKIDDDGIKVKMTKGDKAFMRVKPDEVEITYVKIYQAFYALKILANSKKKEFDYEIKCKFENLGIMMDCSRNAVPTKEFLKNYMLTLALMGYNEIQLYTEDTYEIEGEPMFGYLRGKYTVKELKEIVDIAAEYDIEVVPCIQTLAHLNQALRWHCYDSIRDIDDILLIGEEKTYELIEKMFITLQKAFTSRRVHIGMDEAHNVGKGKYYDKNGSEDRFKLMLKHLTRVVQIAEKYGFEPMMWSDMFFRLANNGEYYAQPGSPAIPQEVINLVPMGLKLVYWDYYRDQKEDYDAMFARHAEFTGNETVFAGGAWRWSGFVPHNRISCYRTKAAITSAVEHDIKSFLVTLWGDDGAECSWAAILPTLSYTADLAYGCENYEESFATLTGLNFNEFCLLDLEAVTRTDCTTESKVALYNDLFMGIFDPYMTQELENKFATCAPKLHKIAKNTARFGYAFETIACLCDVLAIKTRLGVRTRSIYNRYMIEEQNKKENAKEFKKLIAKSYKPLEKKLDKFYEAFKKQWYKENKPMGFEVQDVRLGGLMKRVQHCRIELEKLLKGEITRIPELDLDIVKPGLNNVDENRMYFNNYAFTVTTSKL